jgi:ABC-type phosphate transport system permease subunit
LLFLANHDVLHPWLAWLEDLQVMFGRGFPLPFLIGRIIMITVGLIAAVCLGVGSVVYFRQRDGRG